MWPPGWEPGIGHQAKTKANLNKLWTPVNNNIINIGSLIGTKIPY